MGLFSNKENPFLPVAKKRLYIEYQFPNSGSVLMTNFAWFDICLKNLQSTGKKIWSIDYPIDATSLFIQDKNYINNIGKRISGVAEEIIDKVEEVRTKDFIEILNSQLVFGGALALVEMRSGLSINGFMHPSIQNSIAFLKIKKDKKDNFDYYNAQDKALEIGYGLLRYSGEPVTKFLNGIRKIGE